MLTVATSACGDVDMNGLYSKLKPRQGRIKKLDDIFGTPTGYSLRSCGLALVMCKPLVFVPGETSGGFSARRVQWLRVRIWPDRHRQDAHYGRYGRTRGHHPARLPPHLGAHREQCLSRRHASGLLLLHRAVSGGCPGPPLQGLQETHY